MLTGKYSGANARSLTENDLRYERFQRPETVAETARRLEASYLAEQDEEMARRYAKTIERLREQQGAAGVYFSFRAERNWADRPASRGRATWQHPRNGA